MDNRASVRYRGLPSRPATANGPEQLRAVKIISKANLNVQELEVLVELQDHPDLFIRFLGWFEDPARDTIHIAMEYLQHGDLGQYIAMSQSKADPREITSQILEELVVLHEREICHRDLKPQNILVVSISPIWVKVTDFGISKRWVGTSLKTQCGSTLYRLPEQLGLPVNSEPVETRTPAASTYGPYQDPDMTSTTLSTETAVDMDLLHGYCHDLNPFPCVVCDSTALAKKGSISSKV